MRVDAEFTARAKISARFAFETGPICAPRGNSPCACHGHMACCDGKAWQVALPKRRRASREVSAGRSNCDHAIVVRADVLVKRSRRRSGAGESTSRGCASALRRSGTRLTRRMRATVEGSYEYRTLRNGRCASSQGELSQAPKGQIGTKPVSESRCGEMAPRRERILSKKISAV